MRSVSWRFLNSAPNLSLLAEFGKEVERNPEKIKSGLFTGKSSPSKQASYWEQNASVLHHRPPPTAFLTTGTSLLWLRSVSVPYYEVATDNCLSTICRPWGLPLTAHPQMGMGMARIKGEITAFSLCWHPVPVSYLLLKLQLICIYGNIITKPLTLNINIC